jgi:hypothetical protein
MFKFNLAYLNCVCSNPNSSVESLAEVMTFLSQNPEWINLDITGNGHTPLNVVSCSNCVPMMKWLLNHEEVNPNLYDMVSEFLFSSICSVDLCLSRMVIHL